MGKIIKFKCPECKRYITAKNVSCMDIVLCIYCKKEVLVPEDYTVKEANSRIYRPKTPCEKKRR